MLKMLFSAEITDFRIICNVLRAIAIKDFIYLRPMQEGLKVILDEMHCMEISAYIPRAVFSHYKVTDETDVILKVCLKTLVEILNIFGDDSSPSLKLSYRAVGEPLCLIMNHSEDNVTVDCEIKTMNYEDLNDIGLAEECSNNKVVIKADMLMELLVRLDDLADELKVTISPQPPHFAMATTGIAGESEVTISKNSEAVSVHECTEKISSTYSYANVKHVLKVMNLADKVAVSLGESGLLGLQLVINSEDKQLYVEYYVTSQFCTD